MNIFTIAEKLPDGTTKKRNLCSWFPFPSALWDSLLIAKLSPVGMRLIGLLYKMAQKHSATVIELPDREAADLLGTDRETIIRARRSVLKAKLVNWSNTPGFSTYTILNPETHEQLPIPNPDRSGVRRYKRDRNSLSANDHTSAVGLRSHLLSARNHTGSRHVVTPTAVEVHEPSTSCTAAVSLKPSLIKNSEQMVLSDDPYEVAEREAIQTEHMIPWSEIGAEPARMRMRG